MAMRTGGGKSTVLVLRFLYVLGIETSLAMRAENCPVVENEFWFSLRTWMPLNADESSEWRLK